MPKLASRTLKHQSPRSSARVGLRSYSDDELRETGTAELQAGNPKRLVATIFRLRSQLAAARFNELEAEHQRDKVRSDMELTLGYRPKPEVAAALVKEHLTGTQVRFVRNVFAAQPERALLLMRARNGESMAAVDVARLCLQIAKRIQRESGGLS